MPLEYVEKLTELLILCGYISQPRSLSRRREFETRVELLVMACLYILGNVGTLRKCCTLMHISSSEVCKFWGKLLKYLVLAFFCNPRTVEPTHTYQEQLIVVKHGLLAAQKTVAFPKQPKIILSC